MKKSFLDGLYSIKQAAKYKKMEFEAFRYYCIRDRGPKADKLDGRWIFRKEDLDVWEPIPLRIKENK